MKNKEVTGERIRNTLDKIVKLFENGDVPQAIRLATFPRFMVPSAAWSLANRLLMLLAGTSDARGFWQWQKAGRQIRQGEKAFYILAPRLVEEKEAVETEESERYICRGFFFIPVFRVEQTAGEPLDYQKIELPHLPLIEKAQEWGIEVRGVSFQDSWYGYYRQGIEERPEKIGLASPEETVFFHELAHAAHRRILGQLKPWQDAKQEIVAELSAQVLAELIGRHVENTLGNSLDYIAHYAQKIKRPVGQACLSVIAEVEKVLQLILEVPKVRREVIS